jgi:hypothetical protein
LPKFFTGIELWKKRGQRDDGKVGWQNEIAGLIAASTVHDQNDFLVGVSLGQLLEIETHDLSVDPRQKQGK